MRGAAAAAVACLVTLALAATAQAAPRYSSPAGSGTECSATVPCEIQVAVSGAISGDEVIVGAGTYGIGNQTLAPVEGVDVHGEFGGPRPVIVSGVMGNVVAVVEADVEYLELVNSGVEGGGVSCASGGRIDRVRALATASFASAIVTYGQAQTCSVGNSVAVTSGASSSALRVISVTSGPTTVIRNVTAIAGGAASRGITAFANEGNPTIDLKNSIARATEFDLRAEGFEGGTPTIRVSHSNFVDSDASSGGKVIDEGGNQTAPPLFVNAAGGDYREAPGSPTIDAGVNNQLGPLDLDGNTRVLGAAPDIGAYEFPSPPLPPTPSAELQSLAVSPKAFTATNFGGAIISKKKTGKAPVTSTVTYTLTLAATVAFSVERKLIGRKSGKKCVKKTKANKGKKKCPLFKPVKGGFTHSGAAGASDSPAAWRKRCRRAPTG